MLPRSLALPRTRSLPWSLPRDTGAVPVAGVAAVPYLVAEDSEREHGEDAEPDDPEEVPVHGDIDDTLVVGGGVAA